MRIIAQRNLNQFAATHPETAASIQHWVKAAKSANWSTPGEVQQAFSKAKVLDSERVRFEIAGGNYRLIVAFRFDLQIAFIKFLGTHTEYDRVDALTVGQF